MGRAIHFRVPRRVWAPRETLGAVSRLASRRMRQAGVRTSVGIPTLSIGLMAHLDEATLGAVFSEALLVVTDLLEGVPRG